VDATEARTVLLGELARYRSMPYAALAARIGEVDASRIAGAGGSTYQVEIEVRWDGRAGDNIRVLGGIDDGSWRASFAPLTESFIVAPDGAFVGEG
jgi:hypothetical protein